MDFNINKLKNELIEYKFTMHTIEFDDELRVILIFDSCGVESIPYEKIDDYYIVYNHVKPHENKLGIKLVDEAVIKIPIKCKLLQQVFLKKAV